MRSPRQAPKWILAIVLLAWPQSALAEGSSEDKAAAEALFQDGKKLVAQQRFSEACAKFADSQHFDPGVGTLLNLADCYEKNGQLASAWATYKEVVAAAKAPEQAPREQMALAHAAALEPKLPQLLIQVPADDAAGVTEVKQDGRVIARAVWGVPLPVDPGDHVVEAAGPGRKPWSGHVAAVEGKLVTVKIPALAVGATGARLPPSSATGAPTSAESTGLARQKMVALVVAGAGVVGIGIASALGLSANAEYKNADCPAGNVCAPSGFDDRKSAISRAKTASIVFGAGAAVLVGGIVLWFTAPTSRTAVSAQPMVGKNCAGLAIGATW
ncbi:MAG TPA: hypothetical protein VGL19_04270 [Polyangiaceae bacterium]|jgi:hypothetical protein